MYVDHACILATCDHHLVQFWVRASSPLARRKLIMPSTPPNITGPRASNDMAVMIYTAQSLPPTARHATPAQILARCKTPARTT